MSDSEDDVPPQEVCEQRCQEFAQITDTDSALAMFYLQDRKWDLQQALNAFFESMGQDSPDVSNTNSNNAAPTSSAATTPTVVDPQPHRIRLMSWNIDGLDGNNVKTRAKGVCATINKEKPDVVYLQEVVPVNLDVLEEGCPEYQVVPSGQEGYFTAVMLRVSSTEFKDHAITPFFSSKMGRNLLEIKAKVKGIPFHLMTSHFESTKPHAAERKRQLTTALKEAAQADKERTVIFGGDLNLRDTEVQEMGGLPDNILDLWEVTGKRPEAKFTWDTTRNDNLEWNQKFKPRCRFDRLYMRHPTEGQAKTLKPVYFELIGLERLEGCRRFPSDHWGILAHFDKVGYNQPESGDARSNGYSYSDIKFAEEENDKIMNDPKLNPLPPYTVFVGGLPLTFTEDDIQRVLFSPLKIKSTHLGKNKEREGFKFQGQFAFVEFFDLQSLKDALTYDGVLLESKNLRINVAERRNMPPNKRAENVTFRPENISLRPENISLKPENTPRRPKLNLKPRTVKDEPGAVSSRNSSIFGTGKPRDEFKSPDNSTRGGSNRDSVNRSDYNRRDDMNRSEDDGRDGGNRSDYDRRGGWNRSDHNRRDYNRRDGGNRGGYDLKDDWNRSGNDHKYDNRSGYDRRDYGNRGSYDARHNSTPSFSHRDDLDSGYGHRDSSRYGFSRGNEFRDDGSVFYDGGRNCDRENRDSGSWRSRGPSESSTGSTSKNADNDS